MQDAIVDKETQSLESMKQSETKTSKNLLQNVSMQLVKLMTEVTKKEINPETVKAACGCAAELCKLLKLNLEIKKLND